MAHYVYMLRCSNDTLYTGYTTDVDRRYREHQRGTPKCKYTRSFPPKELLAYWEFDTATEAKQTEAAIKKLPRVRKLQLIAGELVVQSIGG